MRDYEAMWEAAGGRISASVGRNSAVAVLGDDPAATGAVALGVARAHAQSRRVFMFDLLGDGQGLVSREAAEENPGVSDMVYYGLSLGRVARPRAESPNLFVIPGGAESPLSAEILTHRWWQVVADQIRRSQGLLLVVAPSMVPGIATMLQALDGVLLVGDAVSPSPGATVLAEIRASSAMRTPTGSNRTISSPPSAMGGARWRLPVALLALAVVVGGAFTSSRWRPLLGLGGGKDGASGLVNGELPPIPPPVPSSAPVYNEAAYSVELLFTNSNQDALAYVAESSDSLPAATYSTVAMGAESDRWYRLIAGAFPDSSRADSFLATLRQNGRVTTGAGVIARTPFALLLDSASSDAIAQVRVSAYRGRGIPAYFLRDSTMVWRVYAGAFPAESDASLLKQQLDSLNIQSVLVMRTGSTP